MAKRLNVNLGFTADTSQAKREIQDLQSQLAAIAKLPTNTSLPLTKEIQEASLAAIELQQHLSNATNMSTGTLDFSKLSQSLKKSHTDLMSYAISLKNIGPEGQKAFMSLANAISKAEIPIKRSNSQLQELAITLKNTARWQISSSVLHSFMGAIQSAYGYAKDLNESLNNIRIVTGQNAEQMSVFAQEANKAAQALSTTTTEYTNASLIYFQQGLNTDEVKERTDITIKMAQAAGQSVVETSDQLTAVWNNFYEEGGQSLEHYADAMVRLGADTASSSDEIAGGLEKFASIGTMIGLSFDNAAAALATITAVTRQSEDVVGTALKTIFARIQGLSLGETLDDGTDLNKYSKALEAVGISIFDQNKELKDMDTILDEMGAKWQTLSRDQQVALAQTVAGVRQYNQLVSLMDNFDFYRQNVETAQNADGSLQEQADIYAKSWEASRDRVTAAAEEIYAALLDEDFFIGLNDFLTVSLKGISTFIDSVGGLNGVLIILGTTITRVFGEQMAQGLRNMAYNIKMSTEAGRNAVKQEKITMLKNMGEEMSYGVAGEGSAVGSMAQKQYEQQIILQAELESRKEQMNNDEIAHVQRLMDLHRQLGEVAIDAVRKQEQAKENIYNARLQGYADILKESEINETPDNETSTYIEEYKILLQELKTVETRIVNLKTLLNDGFSNYLFDEIEKDLSGLASQCNVSEQELQGLVNNLRNASNAAKAAGDKLQEALIKKAPKEQIEVLRKEVQATGEALNTAKQQFAEFAEQTGMVEQLSQKSGRIQGKMRKDGVKDNNIQTIVDGYRDMASSANTAAQSNERADDSLKHVSMTIAEAKGNVKDWANNIVYGAQAVGSFAMVLSSLKGAMNTLSDPDISGFEKFITVLTSSSMIITGLVQTISALSQIKGKLSLATVKETVATLANAAAEAINAAATRGAEKAKRDKASATSQATQETNENTVSNLANAASEDVAQKKNVSLKESFSKLGNSVRKFASNYSKWIAGAAAAAAIITTAVIIHGKLEEAYNKDAIAAAEAAEAANLLADNYSNVKSAYEDFMSTVESYNNATSGLDGLIEGTDEYKAAVLEANDAALKLIQTVQGLSYSINDQGLIEIDEDSLARAQEKQQKQLLNAQNASLSAQQRANNAQLKADSTEYNRNVAKNNAVSADDWNTTGQSAMTGMAVGAAAGLVGAAIGSVVPVIGTVIGAGIGLLVGAIGGAIQSAVQDNDQTQYEEDALKAITDYYGDYGDAAFTEEGVKQALTQAGLSIDQEYIDSILGDNIDATRELVQALYDNTQANEALQSKLVTENFGEEISDQINLSDEQKDQLTSGLGKELEDATSELYEDKFKDKGKLGGGITDAEIQKQYAEAMGWDTENIENKSGNKATYYDKEGNVVAEDLSDETARWYLAQQEVLANMGQTVDDYIATFNKLNNIGNNITDNGGTLLTSMVGGEGPDVDLATKGQLDAFNKKINAEDFEATDLISDEEAAAMGYEDAEAYVAALQDGINNANETWNVLDSLNSVDFDTSNISLGVAKSLNNILTDINLGPLGQEAGQEFVNGLTNMIDGLSAEDQNAALAQLTNIDWSSWNAMDQAQAIMKEFGVDIDTSSEAWANFTDRMRDANGAVPDFTSLKQTLIDISSILGNLEFGDTISDEDYEKLIAYNAAWSEFFMLQADGTRKFIGNSQQMLQATRDNINEQRKELKARQEAQAAFEKANWGHEENGTRVEADWKNKSGSDTATATNLMNSTNEGTQAMLEILNYSPERIQEMIDQANSADEQIKATGEAALKEMYDAIYNFTQEDLDLTEEELNQMMASTATNIGELQSLLESGEISAEAYTGQLDILTTSAMNNASSFEELQQALAIATQFGADANYEAYSENLIRIAENYSNCTDEINDYTNALASGNEAQIAAAQSALETAVALGELAESYGFDAEETENYAKRLKEANKNSNMSLETAGKLAVANQRLDRGLANLNDNFEDYTDSLKKNSKTSAEWSKTMDAVKEDLGDILNFDPSDLTDGFVEGALASGDLKAALDGNVDAILRLKAAAADNMMLNVVVNQTETPELLKSKWEYVKTWFAENDITAPNVNQANIINAFNEMIAAGNMTKEQIEAALAGLNVSANVTTTYVPQTVTVPQTITEEAMLPGGTSTVMVPGEDGEWKEQTVYLKKKVTRTYDAGTVEVQGVVPQYTIEGTEGPGGITTAFSPAPAITPSFSSTTSGRPSSGGGGGGSGGGSSTTKEHKTSNNRYHDIDKQISAADRNLSKLQREGSRVGGMNAVSNLQEQVKAIDQSIQLIKKKKAEAEAYLQQDSAEVLSFGYNIEFNADGEISNYEAVAEQALAEYNKAVDSFNAGALNEEAFEKAEKKYEDFIAALEQYEETRDLLYELEESFQDLIDEAQSAAYEAIMKEFDLKIEINDMKLEEVEYYSKKIGDNFYRMGEAAANTASSVDYMLNKLQTVESSYADLQSQYTTINPETGETYINQEQYLEGLKEMRGELLSTLESILDLDDEMMHFYEDTLDKAQDEIDKYTDQIRHGADILEHYRNVLSLIGREQDYKSMIAISDGQIKVIQNLLDAEKANYQSLLAEKAHYEEVLADSTLGEKEREMLQAEYDALLPVIRDAHSEVMSLTEELAEAAAQKLADQLADARKQLEEALTGGLSMDEYLEDIERTNKLQEEYLTTTNKLYETNKLIRKAEQDMEKTTSKTAKDRYNQYIQETKELQEKNKLSEYELSIQQAKYDLLQAELALEDVRNNQSKVRLTRNEEGNWSYTYTADSDAIAEAEQAVYDAQNNLYNIGLEGAQDYQSKYAETMQEAVETFQQINENYQAGMYASEQEYNDAMLAAQEYYYNLLEQYGELYHVAKDTMIENSANNEIDYIFKVQDSEKTFEEATQEYLNNCNSYFDEWQKNTSGCAQEVSQDLDDLQQNINDVTQESQNLANKVTGEVIPAIQREYEEVRNATASWAAYRDALYETIAAYEQLMAAMSQSYASTSGVTSSGTNFEDDYSALIANLLNQGYTMDSEEIQQLLKERDEKIEWLKDQGIGQDYWVHEGQEAEDWLGQYENESNRQDDWFQNTVNSPVYSEQFEEWLKKNGITLATGGYTGDWGPSAKLAWLHEKELVLNADDTANLLNTIMTLRDITSTLEQNALVASLGLNGITADAIGGFSKETLSQEVTIHATFPNVSDRNEVAEALLTLVNDAAQYMETKK